MERKIGEIFEYNGEWYQCVKSDGTCNGCVGKFQPYSVCNGFKECVGKIFKKLEKVGETYDDCGTILQRFRIHTNVTNADTKGLELHIYSNNTIGIEIKQNEEDMKDNRTINQHFAECEQTINDVVRKCYTENKSTQVKDKEEYKMYDAKKDIPEFDKVVDECLFGEDKLNLKPFDLEAAKAGKPACTRDGRKARIICFDLKNEEYPIVAAVGNDSSETLFSYTTNGEIADGIESDKDLMMLPEKKEQRSQEYRGRFAQ